MSALFGLRNSCWTRLACLGVLSVANAVGPGAVRAEETIAAPREAWTGSHLAGTPDPAPPYRIEPAFPHLKFEHPLDIVAAPAGDKTAPASERIFVVEQAGKIFSFVNDSNCQRLDLVADLKQSHPELTAVYALAFHPNFERNRLVYVCYVQGSDVPDGSFISEFELTRTDPPTLDPASERVVLRWWAGGHNGCCLKFGPDGYLYISTGDGGAPAPPDPLHAGQDVSRLLSAILRIDVDRRDGDRPYAVPADNPLIGIPDARPEIWAYGFRNPWRMSFDRQRGDLWVGDVGWQLWEMIYRVERGGNYGWSIMEGPQPVQPEAQSGPTPILPPTVSHPHSEASSITGGFVYHGSRLPDLEGVYIYGDFQSGKIWGLRHDGQQVAWHKELANTPIQIVGFGEDRAGELYLLDYERSQQIYRLAANPDDGRHAAFPRKLSETGLFSSAADQTPAPGVVAYAVNAAHWADHATSERWLAVPGADPVKVTAEGAWQFPEGAVLAKTVSIEMERGAAASRRRLETQILHREEGSWRPYTYIWNDEQTDAELAAAAGASRTLRIRDSAAPEGVREQTYRFASRAECQLCHNPWVEKRTTIYGVQSASPLAVTVPQLNRPAPGGDGAENQLAALMRRGVIAGELPANSSDAPRYANPYDRAADLNERVRSYLHVNCSHCHQPHAGGSATIELTYDIELAEAKLLDVRPTQGAFGISHAKIVAPADPAGSVLQYRMAKLGGGRMPRLGSEEVDEQGVAMVYDWIAQLPPASGGAAPATTGADATPLAALQAESPATRADAIRRILGSTRGALALVRAIDRGELGPQARRQVVQLAAEHSLAEVRDLFERFVPASQRQKRLGNAIDRAELLALAADAERGRQLFFREGAASCKSCHRVNNMGETLGPDLSQVGKKHSPSDMLTHLLEPSRFIEPKYIPYTLETVDGRVLTGLLIEKNGREVLLKNPQNQEVRVPVADVEMLVPQQKSLMPELLLRDMTPQQAADLLAFLTSLK